MEHYQKSQKTLFRELESASHGLTTQEAQKRLALYGPNVLEENKPQSLGKLFLEAFLDPMMLILTALVVIQLFLGEWIESIVIFSVLLLNACISVVQTRKAESSLAALREISAATATVLRGGEVYRIGAKEVVIGDIVLLEAGDFAPADGRILSLSGLKMDEGILTGEADSVLKTTDTYQENLSLGDQKNMVFSGTLCVSGRGNVLVTAIGKQAQLGKIASLIENAQKRQTPLQERLTRFSKRLGLMIFGLCIVIFLIQTARIIDAGGDLNRGLLDALMFSIAVAVAAIPEALSSIITIVLAGGTKKMAKEHAIIRKLPAVEALGSTTVICTDKTGTLTQNKMTVQDYFSPANTKLEDSFLLEAMVLCNDAQLDHTGKTLGDPTETALLDYADLQGLSFTQIKEAYPRAADLPFDSQRKRMSVLCQKEGKTYHLIKGAPDVLFPLCSSLLINGQRVNLDKEQQGVFKEKNEAFSKNAYRVLAFALKEVPTSQQSLSPEDETGFALLGLVAMSDPPRKEVYHAIETAKSAGIKTVMITGDHKTTAYAIGKDIGILETDSLALTGAELDNLSKEDLEDILPKVSVFARVSPEHKIRIVETWQALGHIVAMTGDGVNDAPSLKQADIGIAMGSGTEVSKDASAMVLTDDNFTTIISAIHTGRTIFDNIKKSIAYLFSGNLAGIIAILFALLLAWDKPFTALQILFINLVNDSLPAIAIGLEKPEPNIMSRTPRKKEEGIFGDGLLESVVVRGVIMGVFTILAQFLGTRYAGAHIGSAMAFSTLLLCRTLQTFSARSNSQSIFKLGFFSNMYAFGAVLVCLFTYLFILLPGIRSVFYLPQDFSFIHLAITFGFALLAVLLMEIPKFFPGTFSFFQKRKA